MTERQRYQVVSAQTAGDGQAAAGFELRRYPEHVVAEVEVTADFEDAGNRAFRYLFGYISGDNTARQSIDMTSPVVQSQSQSQSQRIAMTAPVVQTAAGENYTVAFVLPATLTEASAPLPSRPEVALRTVPEKLAAAVEFTGRWTKAAYVKHRAELLSAVADAGLTPIGEPWFARFDPPYTPWFLRHNEVVVEVIPHKNP